MMELRRVFMFICASDRLHGNPEIKKKQQLETSQNVFTLNVNGSKEKMNSPDGNVT